MTKRPAVEKQTGPSANEKYACKKNEARMYQLFPHFFLVANASARPSTASSVVITAAAII